MAKARWWRARGRGILIGGCVLAAAGCGGQGSGETVGADTPTRSESTAHSADTGAIPVPEIAFNCDGDICVMRADGTGQKNITNSEARDDSPTWSPDGERIAFTSDLHKPGGNREIYTMASDGSQVERLTETVGENFAPKWSPDGSRLVFFSQRRGRIDIYTINVDGTGELNLTNDRAVNFDPAWGPDEHHIVMVTALSEGNLIFVMNDRGRGIRFLGPGISPAWSPDGSKLAFVEERGISAYDFRSRSVHRVTKKAFDAEPSWSPDGRSIVFRRGETAVSEIYVVEADGGGLRQLTDDSTPDTVPVWSPAG